MSKVLIYSQEDLDLILELEKQKNEELQQENKKLNGAIQTYDILLKSNVEENKQLKEQLERSEKARKEAIKYLYEHSQYVDEYGIHYIKENEYCVDYLLDILDIDKGE